MFVYVLKYICLNLEMYLSKFRNVFVQVSLTHYGGFIFWRGSFFLWQHIPPAIVQKSTLGKIVWIWNFQKISSTISLTQISAAPKLFQQLLNEIKIVLGDLEDLKEFVLSSSICISLKYIFVSSVILYFLSVADSNPCISQQTGTSFAQLTFFAFLSHFVKCYICICICTWICILQPYLLCFPVSFCKIL